MQSDTAPIFLLQATTAPELAEEIPEGLRFLSAYPQNPISGALDFTRKSGRFNVVNVFQYWFTARVFGINADAWRLIPILAMAIAVGLSYVTMRRMGVMKPLALMLAGWLMFTPLSAWVNYNKAESLGMLFVSIAIYVALYRPTVARSSLAAFAMLMAVLSKEAFVVVWPLVVLLPLALDLKAASSESRKKTFIRLFPHLAALAILMSIVVFISATGSTGTDYAFGNSAESLNIIEFSRRFIVSLTPLVTGEAAALGLLVAIIVAAFMGFRSRLGGGRNVFDTQTTIVAACIAGIAAHGIIHFTTGRFVEGRYIIPGNMLWAIAAGIIGTWAWNRFGSQAGTRIIAIAAIIFALAIASGGARIEVAAVAFGIVVTVSVYVMGRRNVRNSLFAGLAVILFLPLVSGAAQNAALNRVDQNHWWGLVETIVEQAPQHAHIVVEMDEIFAIETVIGLEAFALLMGRTDLEFHVVLRNPAEINDATTWSREVFDQYNSKRELRPTEANPNIVFLTIDRGRLKSTGSQNGSGRVSALIDFFKVLYGSGGAPYLNYTLTYGNP